MAARTDRAERLLNLINLFLAADEPVPFSRIRELFPGDYAGTSEAAAERKFERDKAELQELGVPLRFVQAADDQPDGYVVDRETYYLRDLDLSVEEVTLLTLAGSAALKEKAFPLRADLKHALDKLLYATGRRAGEVSGGDLVVAIAAAPDLEPNVLEELGRAIAARKNVTFTYRAFAGEETRRTVSPFGVACRRGSWFLVGHCHLRKALRTFQVERVSALVVNEVKQRSPDFDVPKDFDLGTHVSREGWQFSVHAPVTARVRLDAGLALLAPGRFGSSARLSPEDDGGVVVTIDVTNRDALVREVLALSPGAELLEPAEWRELVREAAERIVAQHEEVA